jgi:hypothetical protein
LNEDELKDLEEDDAEVMEPQSEEGVKFNIL